MKNKMMKVIALSLCTVIAAGAVGGAALALGDNDKKEEKKTTVTASENTEEEKKASKDETVYVIVGADGSVKKIIVSDWIKNTLNEKTLTDSTSLDSIVNVKGDESYTMGGSGSRVWDAEGNDIYYQGNIDSGLPVGLKISYKLDGESISPELLKGKSGRVTIRYDYENRQYENVSINGREEKIYVPFAMLTGMILDNDVFTNIEVSNGKLINDGTRTIVAGLAFPGLQEDIGIDKEKFEIPDYVEVTADVKDFSLGMTVTVATNELFNKLDPDKLGNISELGGSLDELSDAMKKLIDGSSKLYDGLETLLEKSDELVKGIDELASGAKKLKDGAKELDSGAGKLKKGADELADGLNTLADNNDKLNGGAEQIFDSLLSTAKTQLEAAGLTVPKMTKDNYSDVLTKIIDSLDDDKVYAQALKTVTDTVESKRDYITEQVTAAVKTQVEAGVKDAVKAEVGKKVTAAVKTEVEAKVMAAVKSGVEEKVTEAVKAGVTTQVTEAVRAGVAEKVINAAAGMDKASYDKAVKAGLVDKATQDAVSAAVDAQMRSDEIKLTIEQNVTAQMGSDAVVSTIKAQTDSQMGTDTVKQTAAQNVKAQMESENVKDIISSKTEEQMGSADVRGIISSKISEKMSSDDIRKLIAQKTEEQVKKAITDAMAGDEVRSKLAGASEGAKKVISLKTSLDSYKTFYLGLKDYTGGVAKAADGAGQLSSGADELKKGSAALSDGADKLYDGILKMKDGMPSLVEGITKLRDGSMSLSDGLKEFDEKGVQKIIDAVDGDLSGILDRVKATIKVSKNYRNFSGISDEMNGQVKFIYRTDGIGE